jgi:F0F1-type ATP synthase membrane subunit a
MFKDSTISAKAKKRELFIFLACFAAAFLLNAIGIVKYKTQAKELVGQLHTVLILTLSLYALVVVLRVIYHLIARLWRRN